MANQYTKAAALERKEIIWNVINSLLSGGLVFFGALLNGGFSWRGVGLALAASAVVALTKFKDYWSTEENEYTSKAFQIIG